jgi:hypothetical protein
LHRKPLREERKCNAAQRNYHEDSSKNSPPNTENQGYPPKYQQLAPSQYHQAQVPHSARYQAEGKFDDGAPNAFSQYPEKQMIGDSQYVSPREVPVYEQGTSNRRASALNWCPKRREWQERTEKN